MATVEATSSWYWLRDPLEQQDVPLTLAHAKFVKAIAYAKVKADAVDALTLAQLHRVDLIPRAHMVSPELRPMRDLLRTRLHLVEKRTSAENSIQRLLEKFNVPEPARLPDEATLQASLYEEQIELLTDQIRRIETQLQPQLIPDPDIQRLLWIPGVGKIVAFTLYLEIDGIERFDAVKQFFSYCRVVPGAHNSGGKSRHTRRKDGNRYLKLALSHAAVRAVQYYPESGKPGRLTEEATPETWPRFPSASTRRLIVLNMRCSMMKSIGAPRRLPTRLDRVRSRSGSTQPRSNRRLESPAPGSTYIDHERAGSGFSAE